MHECFFCCFCRVENALQIVAQPNSTRSILEQSSNWTNLAGFSKKFFSFRMVQKRIATYFRKRRDKLSKALKGLVQNCRMAPVEGVARRPSTGSSVAENPPPTRKIFSRWFLIYALKTVLLISLYFAFSIGLTFYQKKFIQVGCKKMKNSWTKLAEWLLATISTVTHFFFIKFLNANLK